MSERRCDVAIIGGGPAGSAAATVLARQGLDAVVLDRERFPRFHVGERAVVALFHLIVRTHGALHLARDPRAPGTALPHG